VQQQHHQVATSTAAALATSRVKTLGDPAEAHN